MSSASEPLNIVILGASCAGLSAFHYFNKHILPTLPVRDNAAYHVYLVDPSTEFYWRVGGPRALASAQLMPNSKLFLPIAPHVAQYDSKTVTFLVGTAKAWDPVGRTVTISTGESTTTTTTTTADEKPDATQVLTYHALILATGTRTPSPLLSLHTTAEESKTALSAFRSRLGSAKSILVAGGGPSGVEAAGELGEYLNGRASFFTFGPLKNPKVPVTLATDGDKILPALRPAIAADAEKLLGRVGVTTMHNARMESATENADGTTTVVLGNGDTVTVDLFVKATGVMPNTEFVPEELKTAKGYVKTNAKTLRVDEAGERVYALGDVGSYTRGGVMDIFDAAPVCMTNVKRDLHAWAKAVGEKEGVKPKGTDREYKANEKETQIVPIGQSKGVGAVFGWKLPSFMVWMIKGRDYLASTGVQLVSGSKWQKESKWKLDA
ncbi:FAD/NAD(P)-binding domain-containing protein [Saccharata proteae CBS 121410]|uniref:FAD/NAD(P)-binding domain-containing protein n=1 Tax=Saccharata proteae CBS 121410 TaxID=1314787 RepID=A0A9P4HKM9_9PEZI|nr:FAD/NAD(P)-binding domain-containing protein [Saccharata proteae CBS 121410]